MSDWDFIVVGAGSAGSVVAGRLSAGGRHTVLVLEAGGSDRAFHVQMPLGYAKSFADPEVNWNFRPEPDPGIAGRVNHWPRGKLLGGSSSINAMVWMHGHPSDFDGWRAAGNPGWSFADVLPDFRAIEDNEAGADEWRGTGGPVHVTDITRSAHPLTRRFIEAGQELGMKRSLDFSGADQEGIGFYQQNIRAGRRVSASRAFLWPAMKRANLRVETHAMATRILIEGGRAAGVEYRQHGRIMVARARREVVLCGGAINSPQLLQLSGIGPAGVLAGLGISPVVANDNVGAHLQDHQTISYVWRARVPTLNRLLGTWWGNGLIGSRYLLTRGGPLAMSVNQGGAFLRSRPDLTRPNLQLYFQAMSSRLPGPGEKPGRQVDPWAGFTMSVSNCHPRSRGQIVIGTPDPLAPPVIRPNALSHPDDVAELVEGVRVLRRLAATKALAPVIAEEMRPGAAVGDDAEVLAADIRNRAGTVFHPSCTCRMGPDAAAGVVSPRLAVHGVERLRVVDASVFPTIVSGNINATTIMVGWRGAGMILEDNA